MEDVEFPSPFKSPSVTDLPRRVRACSASPVLSVEKDAVSPPFRSQNFYGPSSRASSEGRDENETLTGAPGDHVRVNPFEKDILAGLQKSFWSPSILDIQDTPPQRTWAIEHISQLFPKDIENSPSTHQNSFPVDAQAEAKAQADIDVYFSRGPIVPTPSPMKERVIKVHTDVTRLKATSTDVHCGHSPIARGLGGLNGLVGNIKKLKKPVPMTDRWTQTALSLPVDLPDYFNQMLWQYSQNVDLCGTTNETNICTKSAPTDLTEIGDTSDTSKSSTALNNSIRRRLELSFGEEPDGENSSQGLSQGLPASPIIDPFRLNHLVSTPPNPTGFVHLNTTTSELEVQLLRCEFTPEARPGKSSSVGTPGITPIHDDVDEVKFMYQNCSSTPSRKNNVSSVARHLTREHFIPPGSPMDDNAYSSASSSSPMPSQLRSMSCSDNANQLQRRSRIQSPERVHNKKRCSASSFDDSHVLTGDGDSPPAKLHRRSSQDDDVCS